MSTPAAGAGLASVGHVVVLLLENRSFDSSRAGTCPR